MKVPGKFLIALLVSVVLGLLGCGGSNRQLQSLSINPPSVTAQGGQAQFTATGQFNNSPMTVTPAAVSWFQSNFTHDPPFGFSLTTQPFTAGCPGPGTSLTVVAFAPVDANGPTSGSMPMQVFLDLVVNRTMTREGGFAAATAQMTCP